MNFFVITDEIWETNKRGVKISCEAGEGPQKSRKSKRLPPVYSEPESMNIWEDSELFQGIPFQSTCFSFFLEFGRFNRTMEQSTFPDPLYDQ